MAGGGFFDVGGIGFTQAAHRHRRGAAVRLQQANVIRQDRNQPAFDLEGTGIVVPSPDGKLTLR